MNLRLRTLIFIPMLMQFGCISVGIKGGGESSPSKQYSFREPRSPFVEMSAENVDHSWKSSKTSNVLAVMTECNPSKEFSLEVATGDLLSVLSKSQVLDQKVISCNGRDCLMTTAKGTYEGVPAQMQTVVFVKNSCLYQTTYIGKPGRFEIELAIVEEFQKSLVAK